jgi:flavodoxin
MDTLVIYDSVFGNTEKIASAIADALGAGPARRITEIQAAELQGIELLIVGSPTRAFRPTPAMSAYLKKLPAGSLNGIKVTAFDTRMSATSMKKAPGILRFLAGHFGFAAEKIAKGLVKKGGVAVGEPGRFGVEASEGPLTDGELERAAAWAGQLRK